MKLSELAKRLVAAEIIGEGDTEFVGLEKDSRAVEPGMLFLCVKGERANGHDFAQEAVTRGASAIVAERHLELDTPQLIVKDSRLAASIIADYVYGHPSGEIKVIGVTGTNGKTTTTYLLEKILNDCKRTAGVIGTIEARYAGQRLPMSGTTPETHQLQRLLREMRNEGVQYCAMEVSSHALEQGRVKGCKFRSAIFTNLTQDHLDYHGSMDNYAAAKGLLFSRLGNAYGDPQHERSYAILNADDETSAVFRRLTSAEVITYGLDNAADLTASDIVISSEGSSFTVSGFGGTAVIKLRMPGRFNVYNALAAIAASLLEGIPLADIKSSLEGIQGVPGRVETVDLGQPFSVIVDYAHTPDGLRNVLAAVKEFAARRIITVFGCGGDRDRTKRPVMGQIAAEYSDYIIVTSDNPRSENPDSIISEIEAGLIQAGLSPSQYALVADRRKAIEKAVEMASQGDVVLIAGKGHETYQLIGGHTFPFDDRITAMEAIRGILH
jgi:UDP-N-acetylmuramoyl-L-alanyl-D-glutamate--2,6-diaminopimelate ligase